MIKAVRDSQNIFLVLSAKKSLVLILYGSTKSHSYCSFANQGRFGWNKI